MSASPRRGPSRPAIPSSVILNGRLQTFRVAGSRISPEFVYASRPGNPLPDDRTFGVLWAGEDAVAAAFDMQGAFNNLAVPLAPGASAAVGHRGAGSTGSIPTARPEPTNAATSRPTASCRDELAEQRTLAITVPVVFFGDRGLPAQRGARPARGGAARADRCAQGAGLPDASDRPALPEVRRCGLRARLPRGDRSSAIWYGHGMLNNYRPFFRFPELAYTLPALAAVCGPGGQLWGGGGRRRSRPCAGCCASRRPRRCARRRPPPSPDAWRADGCGPAPRWSCGHHRAPAPVPADHRRTGLRGADDRPRASSGGTPSTTWSTCSSTASSAATPS